MPPVKTKVCAGIQITENFSVDESWLSDLLAKIREPLTRTREFKLDN